MATHPTKLQQQARDALAQALVAIAGAARLDGGGRLQASDFREIAARVARVSSAFSLDEIVTRALDQRGRSLGLPGSATELLTLMDAEIKPVDMLLLEDDALRELVARLEAEPGAV